MMTKCILDGFTYPYNPVENQNPGVRVIAATDTFKGRTFTDWGTDVSRQDITQTWPTMKASFFDTLKAKATLSGTLSFTDDDGTVYTVLAEPPIYQRKVPGGVGYVGVTFKMMVVSSP